MKNKTQRCRSLSLKILIFHMPKQKCHKMLCQWKERLISILKTSKMSKKCVWQKALGFSGLMMEHSICFFI